MQSLRRRNGGSHKNFWVALYVFDLAHRAQHIMQGQKGALLQNRIGWRDPAFYDGGQKARPSSHCPPQGTMMKRRLPEEIKVQASAHMLTAVFFYLALLVLYVASTERVHCFLVVKMIEGVAYASMAKHRSFFPNNFKQSMLQMAATWVPVPSFALPLRYTKARLCVLTYVSALCVWVQVLPCWAAMSARSVLIAGEISVIFLSHALVAITIYISASLRRPKAVAIITFLSLLLFAKDIVLLASREVMKTVRPTACPVRSWKRTPHAQIRDATPCTDGRSAERTIFGDRLRFLARILLSTAAYAGRHHDRLPTLLCGRVSTRRLALVTFRFTQACPCLRGHTGGCFIT